MLRLLEDKIATPLGPLWVIADEQFCCAPSNGKSTATGWKNCSMFTTARRGMNVSAPPTRAG